MAFKVGGQTEIATGTVRHFSFPLRHPCAFKSGRQTEIATGTLRHFSFPLTPRVRSRVGGQTEIATGRFALFIHTPPCAFKSEGKQNREPGTVAPTFHFHYATPVAFKMEGKQKSQPGRLPTFFISTYATRVRSRVGATESRNGTVRHFSFPTTPPVCVQEWEGKQKSQPGVFAPLFISTTHPCAFKVEGKQKSQPGRCPTFLNPPFPHKLTTFPAMISSAVRTVVFAGTGQPSPISNSLTFTPRSCSFSTKSLRSWS